MNKVRDFWNLVGPIFTILLIITAIWYASAVWLNSAWAYDKAKRANVSISFSEMVSDTMIQEKPLLPSPHQVIKEIYKTTSLEKSDLKKVFSLAWVDYTICYIIGFCVWYSFRHYIGCGNCIQ